MKESTTGTFNQFGESETGLSSCLRPMSLLHIPDTRKCPEATTGPRAAWTGFLQLYGNQLQFVT